MLLCQKFLHRCEIQPGISARIWMRRPPDTFAYRKMGNLPLPADSNEIERIGLSGVQRWATTKDTSVKPPSISPKHNPVYDAGHKN